jgi:hypothetical protein
MMFCDPRQVRFEGKADRGSKTATVAACYLVVSLVVGALVKALGKAYTHVTKRKR